MQIRPVATIFYVIRLRVEFDIYHLITAFLIVYDVNCMRLKLILGHWRMPIAFLNQSYKLKLLAKNEQTDYFELFYNAYDIVLD